MDPITHAIVGMAIAGKAGGSLSLSNGIMVAATLGAMAPDLDIVVHLWGDYAYLKQHRGFSHSLPGLALTSLALGGLLSFFYPLAGLFTLISWAFWGALSHTLLDLFNSYGVEVLWPLNKKKWTLNLLMIFDPVLFLLFSLVVIAGYRGGNYPIAAMLPAVYLVLRFLMRHWAWTLVMKRLGKRFPQLKVTVLPSLKHFLKWDFIAFTPERSIVGSVDLLKRRCKIVRRFRKIRGEMAAVITDSVLGKVFREFTPFFHVECSVQDDKVVGLFMDLRYRVKGRFLHNGRLVLDGDLQVKEAVFQPFRLSRRIYLT